MEQHDLLSNDLQINPATENQLTEAAKWGKFLGIVGFIFCGLFVVIAFALGSYMGRLGSNYGSGYSTGVSAGVTIVYLIMAVIMFFPFLFLYKFAVKMQQSLRSINQELLDSSFQSLKAMFRFQGILAIISLVFFAFALIGIIGQAL